MFLLRRLLPWILAALSLVILEYGLVHPEFYLQAIGLICALTVLFAMLLLRTVALRGKVPLIIIPLTLIAGVSFIEFFLSSALLRQAAVVMVSGSLGVYFEELYRRSYDVERYHALAIEHLAGYAAIAGLGGMMAGIFALRIFLDVRLVYLLPLTLLIGMIFSGTVFALQPFTRRSLVTTTIIFAILTTEMSLAVHFLPTNYFVNAFIVTLPFYVLFNITRHELNGTLSPYVIRRYTVIGLTTLVVVLATAQWIL